MKTLFTGSVLIGLTIAGVYGLDNKEVETQTNSVNRDFISASINPYFEEQPEAGSEPITTIFGLPPDTSHLNMPFIRASFGPYNDRRQLRNLTDTIEPEDVPQPLRTPQQTNTSYGPQQFEDDDPRDVAKVVVDGKEKWVALPFSKPPEAIELDGLGITYNPRNGMLDGVRKVNKYVITLMRDEDKVKGLTLPAKQDLLYLVREANLGEDKTLEYVEFLEKELENPFITQANS